MTDFDVSTAVIIGATSTVKKIVLEDDTAAYYGSRKLGTLIASPVYVGMMIDACTNIVDSRLPAGLTTVGIRTEITHTAPASLGMVVSVTAALVEAKRDRVSFEITIADDAGITGIGRHDRVVVDGEELIERARKRLLEKL